MIIHNNIPSKQIITKIAKSNKDYGVEFINTECNSDMYSLKIYLRRHHDKFKIRLALISSILAYPALEMIWNFDDDEYELSSRVFHRICDEADEVKTYYDQSMMPASTLSAKIKESVKPISMSSSFFNYMTPLYQSQEHYYLSITPYTTSNYVILSITPTCRLISLKIC